MRLALLVLTISCLSVGTSVLAFESNSSSAQSVESLEVKLSTKEDDYKAFIVKLTELNNRVKDEDAHLSQLRSQGKTLKTSREEALLDMNAQYEAMIDNPDQDIAQAQNAYRQSIIKQKQNKDNISASVANLASAKQELGKANLERFTLANAREALVEEIRIARVQRLRKEFGQEGELEVTQTVSCNTEETLQKCIKRGNLLAKQKASKVFVDKLYSSATESQLIKQHKKDSAAPVRLIKHKVVSGAFSGQGNYGTTISVTLQGSLPNSEACTLLNISPRYCGYEETQPSVPPLNAQADNVGDNASLNDDTVLYQLTIRSNQYDDEVFIDGVSYGSTKLSVMLSAGYHDVVISKPGYVDYQQNLHLSKNQLIKAELNKALLNLSNGERIQDILPGDELGPELIGIPAGRFQMGDMKGAGLSNEKPAHNQQILTAFAIGQNPITVADFKRFVKDTHYVTEAESENGCAAFIEGKPQYNSVLNWRNPGFKQADDHPVVCISDKDSKSYLKWLSKKTDRHYRLPSEIEWEYVARAGSSDNFWWGNDIGNGKANCAYCGSKWSNRSTSPISSFRPNKLGLYDTVGNVWEITDGTHVVARGGAWNFAPKLARTSVRLELSSGFRSNYLGFRALREN